MKSIEEAPIGAGTRVLVRVDWNVSVGENGEVLGDAKIKATLKTINFALEKKAKVILMSHLGEGKTSLEVVVNSFQELVPDKKIFFVKDPFGEEGKNTLASLKEGEIAVLENLRFWDGEKDNDKDFTTNLASFGDVYINEAFPSSHRRHASTVGVPELLPHFAGFHFLEEYQNLSAAFNPEHPFFFILGGAKFETKLPLVEKFLNIADNIFIGGLNAFQAISLPIAQNPKIIFPVGDITALDIGKETLELLERKIKEAKFVIWNGPLGKYEDGYVEGTRSLAKLLSESNAKVVIGGGDTENVIGDVLTSNQNIFISLAGGAMLDFLSTSTLPGIEALK